MNEKDVTDLKIMLLILANIHDRLAELSGSPYRIEVKTNTNGGWEWNFTASRK